VASYFQSRARSASAALRIRAFACVQQKVQHIRILPPVLHHVERWAVYTLWHAPHMMPILLCAFSREPKTNTGSAATQQSWRAALRVAHQRQPASERLGARHSTMLPVVPCLVCLLLSYCSGTRRTPVQKTGRCHNALHRPVMPSRACRLPYVWRR